MKDWFPSISMACLVMLCSGCALILPPTQELPHEAEVFSYEPYRDKAIEFETQGQFQPALFHWKIAAALKPDDAKMRQRIEDLRAIIQWEANRHFSEGRHYLKSNLVEEARHSFLVALRCDPNHYRAFDYLKNKLTAEDHTDYRVREDDTFRDIARRVYRDPEKDFLVAHFTELESDAELSPGMILTLPLLDEEITIRRPSKKKSQTISLKKLHSLDVDKELEKAGNLLKRENYEDAIPVLERILELDPMHAQAREMANISYYQIGKDLKRQYRYSEALRMFRKVEPGYRDVDELTSAVSVHVNEEAERHYLRGVQYFLNEDLKSAIEEWQKTLALDPEHKKAEKDIQKARTILEKLEEVE